MRLAASLLLVTQISLCSFATAADIKQLAAALSTGSPADRQAAADALADQGLAAQEAAPQLIAALAANDPDLRWRAARALGVIGDAQAVPALRKQAADSVPLVRAQALFALGRLKAADEDSLKAIIGRMTDDDVQVRRASIRALRMIEAPRQTVAPLVVKLLNDSDPTVAMRALSTFVEGGVEVVPALRDTLKLREARYWACIALSELGPQAKDAVPNLIEVLADDRPEIRLQATIALGEIGPDAKPAVGALNKLVDDPFESVRATAVFALGRIGDPAALDALKKAAMATDPLQRMLASWALARVNRSDAQQLEEAIQRLVAGLGDKDRAIAHMAAKALADLEVDPTKVRPLVEKMIAANPETSERVLNAFASLGSRAVPHAIVALKDPQRRVRAMQVLARIGPDAAPAVPALAELLKAGDAPTKTEALYALGAVGPGAEPAVETIITQLGDTDPRVAQAASYALGKIGPAANAAIPALAKLGQSEDELLRLTSVWATLKIGPRTPEMMKNAMPILIGALKNSREFVRIEAAITLGDFGPAAGDAVPALESAANDASAAVRSAAAAAIKKIKG